ncbi:hypothetical protein PCASD_00744 [Puccinia coronata f. sp. avenae]|uniref:non-specific serine/threonine protein kinase n=1 Tax=Puccinia coronata f. sp. avenae TaxID=200324 RepID=A0A2N5VL89_9BASI|nr:hypothetical protein PCASD_00744 [Puccinia coronata f. sp. avenae]
MQQSSTNPELRPLTTLPRPTLHTLQPIATPSEQQPLSSSSLSAPDPYSNPSSSVSRASSARSTNSVQAVPFRIPTRLTATATATATAGPANPQSAPLIPQFMVPTTSHSPLTLPALQHLAIADADVDQPSGPPASNPVAPAPLLRNYSAASTVNRKGIKDFIVGDILGEGSYSTVYHVTDKQSPNKEYALKVLDKRHIQKEKKTKYVAIERDTLNLLDHHPGCIRLYSTFQDESSLYYLLEYAPKGEILRSIKTLGSFSTDCARFYAAQILSAIEHMHSRGIIHRDVKPENILLDSEMRIKIADFGSAKILNQKATNSTANEKDSERSHSFVGTAEYVSPELLVQKVTSTSSDLWAFGCVLFQMIAGLPPFRSRSEYLTFQKITQLEYEFPTGFPEEAQNLVSRLLVLEPTARIGASPERGGIGEIKAHAFFASIEWDLIWEIPPPVLEPGLVVAAAAATRPPDTLVLDQPPAAPVYIPEFFQDQLSPPIPSSSQLPIDSHPIPSGLGLALVDHDEHLLPPDSDIEDVDDVGSARTGIGNALSKRKSWLLGAGRKKSKEDLHPFSPGGEMTWAEIYLPNELVIYSSVVNELTSPSSGSGKPGKVVVSLRGKKKKKRQLVLTDYPRLICVKEDPKSSKVRVKFEVLFKPLPTTSPRGQCGMGEPTGGPDHYKAGSASSSCSHQTISSRASAATATRARPESPPSPSAESHLPNELLLFKRVEMESPRCFWIETFPSADAPSNASSGLAVGIKPRSFRFEDKTDAAERWTAEINLAFQVANKPKAKPSNLSAPPPPSSNPVPPIFR